MTENPWKRAIEQRRMAAAESASTSKPSIQAKPPRKHSQRRPTRQPRRQLRSNPERVPVGSMVRLSWTPDPAYGSGVRTFSGKVVECDSWIRVIDRGRKVVCHMPLNMVEVELL